MLETLEQKTDLKSISIKKDTWILEVPAEICGREGFPHGTLVSLTLKNDEVIGEYIKPSQEIDDFIGRIVNNDGEFFEEIKRIGD